MQQWIPAILGLVGLVIQALLLAYFMGKMKENQTGQANLVKVFQEFTQKAIDALTAQMGGLATMANETNSHRAALTARLEIVERNTDGLQTLRETFAGHAATFAAFKERSEADTAKQGRELSGIHRQIASIATGRAGGVVELGAQVQGD